MENTTSKSYPNSQAGRSGTNWHGLGLVMGTYMDTNFDGLMVQAGLLASLPNPPLPLTRTPYPTPAPTYTAPSDTF